MDKNKLKVCYCFPDSLNLHGDLGNMMAFEKVTKLLGAEFESERLYSFYDDFTLADYDILFFSPGELKTALIMADVLRPKKEMFEEFLAKGKHIIVVGTTIALFGGKVTRKDGKTYEGLGIVDITSKERDITYSNDEVYTAELYGDSFEVYGGQIQMIDLDIHDGTPLGEVSYGYGNIHKKDEGLVKDGFIFTNALGPVFVKNPYFAAKIIVDALRKKGCTLPLEIPEFAFEDASNKRIADFIKVKIEKYDQSRLEK